ncbi:Crp/Fnr family transcriptional regulator [Shimia ponticola]|uniref:Crp/Fnr family transcriptional regulator n=1 Tax=Shimia ponticola TaxID=2582893 RepID=UPI0011BEA08C|nr:Crp/Fnr family transcriptional regulator [Shimia ponticola]
MSDLQALLDHPLFAGVKTLDLPTNSVTRMRLDDGQMLFDQMERSRDVYFLMRGAVLAVFWAPDGKELIFNRMAAVDYFGEIAAIDGQERSLSVYASGCAEVLILRRDAFLQVLDTESMVCRRVMTRLVGRVRELTQRTSQLSTQSVDQRVKAFIARRAMDAGVFKPGGELRGLPTQSEIAGLIGANREAVSRAISDMKRSGVIKAGRQRITLVQPNELIEAAAG